MAAVGGLVSLRRWLQQRMATLESAPADGQFSLFLPDIIRRGAAEFLQRARDEPPGLPPGTQRFVPSRLTDVLPVHRQLELDDPLFAGSPPWLPRPGEPVTPRENSTLEEILRIMRIMRGVQPPSEAV